MAHVVPSRSVMAGAMRMNSIFVDTLGKASSGLVILWIMKWRGRATSMAMNMRNVTMKGLANFLVLPRESTDSRSNMTGVGDG